MSRNTRVPDFTFSHCDIQRPATVRDGPCDVVVYGGTEFGRLNVFSLIDTLTSLHDSQALGVG